MTSLLIALLLSILKVTKLLASRSSNDTLITAIYIYIYILDYDVLLIIITFNILSPFIKAPILITSLTILPFIKKKRKEEGEREKEKKSS